jgi:hypothetical protein
MKTPAKILVAFSLLVTGLLITSFYYTIPCRHQAAAFPMKMNVFYIGVDNPIEISACGVAPNGLRPTISNAGATMIANGRPGSYIVRVNGGTETTMNIALGDSSHTSLGMYKFRVKRVPDPVAYLGNLKGDGIMSKPELSGQSGVFARMENFDFDLKFTVVSFSMSVLADGKWVELVANGPGITPEMKQAMAKVVAGDKVIFGKVTVKGPDGTLRKIPGIVVSVK